MFRYIVKGGADPDQLYISELRMQCILATHAYRHLSAYSDVVGKGTVKPLPYSPVDVIAHCVTFLSAVATISKILFPPDQRSVDRGERLRKRLNLPSTFLNKDSRTVRNSFEHIDARIDELLPEHQNDDICFADIDDAAPKEAIVLKRLDLRSRTIEFLGQRIDIEECYRAVQAVERAL